MMSKKSFASCVEIEPDVSMKVASFGRGPMRVPGAMLPYLRERLVHVLMRSMPDALFLIALKMSER